MSDPFRTTSGVRQSCVAMPNLFTVTVDYWLNSLTECCPDVCIEYHFHFPDLCYVDNFMLFAMFPDILIESLEALSEEASPLGLIIRWAMTKLQSLSDFLPPPPPPPPQIININTEEVKVVDRFVYLSSKITSDYSSDPETDCCIHWSRRTFGQLS